MREESVIEADRIEVNSTDAGRAYPSAISAARGAAKPLGYAIGLHGSMQRDLDLIAVPWVNNAADAYALARAIEHATGGYIPDTDGAGNALPVHRPHGRLGWVIHLGKGLYIDLSVMPRQQF